MKVKQAFFHYKGTGVFQGDLNPLSSRLVLVMYVIPTLLNGCENWLMTQALVDQRMELFQGELVKRSLKQH